MKEIIIRNATENNLKGIDVEIPYYKMTVVTGNSGSGKSSLVYDTIYAESQRLMSESLIENTFGMKLLDKPHVGSIENLCPAISICQNSYNFNPNSTVGSYTDIADNIRRIFAIVGRISTGILFVARDFSSLQSKFRCPICEGTGKRLYISDDKIIPDGRIRLSEGGITYFSGSKNSYEMRLLAMICERHGIDIDSKVNDLSSDKLSVFLNGDGEKYAVKFERGSKKNCQHTIIFNGVRGILGEQYKKIHSPMIQKQLSKYLDEGVCDTCHGRQFLDTVLDIKVCDTNVNEVFEMELSSLLNWCEKVDNNYKKGEEYCAIYDLLQSVRKDIYAIEALDIGYLTLLRSIPTLSGGEYQRLRLARQVSGALAEILYILDEPCKGLHRLDVWKIEKVIKNLIKKGNTVLSIEHNQHFIKQADNVITIGPGSGPNGGKIVPNEKIAEYKIEIKKKIRRSKDYLSFEGINKNNIHNEKCKIPLGSITCITGVSGSGKSTLAHDIIYESLSHGRSIGCKKNDFPSGRGKIYYVRQSPIGKNARSSVISYLKIYDEIRNIFSNVKVKNKKYKSSFFSTNVSGGRCEKCLGSGKIQIDSKFFSDTFIKCEECNGTGFMPEILEVRYNGKNIHDVLEMSVADALEFFIDNKKIKTMLSCLTQLGLDYIKLGQLSKDLSGGESQRLKLAKALGEDTGKNNIYILDEPTSGLSEHDIDNISNVIDNIVLENGTVIIIDHNPTFISKNADYIIDFGFVGGKEGGKILDQGYIDEIFQRGKASIWFDK